MAAATAFLHQVEYETALNEFEEEAKRQFDQQQEEERADSDDAPKRELSVAQPATAPGQRQVLRRSLLRGAGGGEKYDPARKTAAVSNWLSAAQEPGRDSGGGTAAAAAPAASRRAAKRRSSDAVQRWSGAPLAGTTAPAPALAAVQPYSRWQPQPTPYPSQQPHPLLLHQHQRALSHGGVSLRRTSSIRARTDLLHRILHVRGFIDGVLPIYNPDTLPRRAWDMLIMVLVMWTAITVPLSVSFGLPTSTEWQIFGYVVTALFAVDLFVNFRTAYYNHQGELVRDSSAIAANYMKFWFWVDLFGTIPFDTIVMLTGVLGDAAAPGHDTSSAELAAVGFLKAPRLLRLGRMLRFLDSFKNAKLFRIAQLFAAMILISHWLACIWYMMYRFGGKDTADDWAFEVAVYDTYDKDGEPHLSGTATAAGGGGGGGNASDAAGGGGGGGGSGGGGGPTVSMYVVTYYYSFLLLVGDNVTAYNNFERAFCVMVLIAGTFFYSAVVGQMATLVATMNVAVNRHGQKLLMVQDALRYAGVPDRHSEKVQKYYEYLQQRSHPGSEGMQFLQELPSSLQLSLCQFLHLRSLHKVPLFQDCEEGFMNALALRIRMISLSPREVIFRVGDVGREMYVIKKGCVAVMSPSLTMWGLLQPGEIFGEVALLSTGKRTANCTALGFVDLAVLTGPDLQVVMRDYPVSASIIYERAATRARALQNKSKMWLDVSADDEFLDCEEPEADDSSGDGDYGGGGNGSEGAGGGGGSDGGDGGGGGEDSPGEEGDAASAVTSPSVCGGSCTPGTSTDGSCGGGGGGGGGGGAATAAAAVASAAGSNNWDSGGSGGCDLDICSTANAIAVLIDSIGCDAAAGGAVEGQPLGAASASAVAAADRHCGELQPPPESQVERVIERLASMNGKEASLNGRTLPMAWYDSAADAACGNGPSASAPTEAVRRLSADSVGGGAATAADAVVVRYATDATAVAAAAAAATPPPRGPSALPKSTPTSAAPPSPRSAASFLAQVMVALPGRPSASELGISASAMSVMSQQLLPSIITSSRSLTQGQLTADPAAAAAAAAAAVTVRPGAGAGSVSAAAAPLARTPSTTSVEHPVHARASHTGPVSPVRLSAVSAVAVRSRPASPAAASSLCAGAGGGGGPPAITTSTEISMTGAAAAAAAHTFRTASVRQRAADAGADGDGFGAPPDPRSPPSQRQRGTDVGPPSAAAAAAAAEFDPTQDSEEIVWLAPPHPHRARMSFEVGYSDATAAAAAAGSRPLPASVVKRSPQALHPHPRPQPQQPHPQPPPAQQQQQQQQQQQTPFAQRKQEQHQQQHHHHHHQQEQGQQEQQSPQHRHLGTLRSGYGAADGPDADSTAAATSTALTMLTPLQRFGSPPPLPVGAVPAMAAAAPAATAPDSAPGLRKQPSRITPRRNDGPGDGSGSGVYGRLPPAAERSTMAAAIAGAIADDPLWSGAGVAAAMAAMTAAAASGGSPAAGPVGESVEQASPLGAPFIAADAASAAALAGRPASQSASPSRAPPVRRRSSHLRCLTGGSAAAAGAVAEPMAGSGGGSGAGAGGTVVISPSGTVTTTLLTNGAAILRLARRSSGLLVPAPSSTSAGASGGGGGGGSPVSLSSHAPAGAAGPPPRRASRLLAAGQGNGGGAAAGAEPLADADEELEWISRRPAYGSFARPPARPQSRRGSVCSIHEEELAALAPGPAAMAAASNIQHSASAGLCAGGGGGGGSPLTAAAHRRLIRSSTAASTWSQSADDCGAGTCTCTGTAISTATGTVPVPACSAAGIAPGAGSGGAAAATRRGSLQVSRSTTPILPSPPNGAAAGGSGLRSGRASLSGLGPSPPPPPPPPPPPDGVFVPLASWEQLLQAVSRLGCLESVVQQLIDLVSEQDEALHRLEQRAERAAALGGGAAHHAGEGILAGIMPPSVLADPAAAAAANGSSSGSISAAASPPTLARAMSLRAPATAGGGGGGGGSAAAGGLSRSDSLEAQRNAGARLRGAVRAMSAAHRMRPTQPGGGGGGGRATATATAAAAAAAAVAAGSPFASATRALPELAEGTLEAALLLRRSESSRHLSSAPRDELGGGGGAAAAAVAAAAGGPGSSDLSVLLGSSVRRNGTGGLSALQSRRSSALSAAMLGVGATTGLRGVLKGGGGGGGGGS